MTRKILRFFSVGLGALAVLLIVGCLGLVWFTKGTVRRAICTGTSNALGLDVSVVNVTLVPFKGQIAFNDLAVKNPEGYQTPSFLDLKQGTVTIYPETALDDPIHIKTMDLRGMRFVMERKGLSSNVQEVVAYIKSQPNGDTEEKSMIIDRLNISDITVQVKLSPLLGKVETMPIELASIEMTDLGQDTPLTTTQLTSQIMLAVAQGLFDKALGILPKGLIMN